MAHYPHSYIKVTVTLAGARIDHKLMHVYGYGADKLSCNLLYLQQVYSGA